MSAIAACMTCQEDTQLTVVERTPGDWQALGRVWLAFEQRVACSFFQSWAWVGCLADERFDDPVLIEVRRADNCVALGLFNRRRRQLQPDHLWLSETGLPSWDSVFIEHNDVLLAPGDSRARGACFAAAAGQRRSLTLAGISEAALASAKGLPCATITQQTRLAPYIDLTAIATAGGQYIDRLSPNTRYQLRRSARRYAQTGALQITSAGSADQRHEFLTALAGLHQAYWIGRGRPGAFANAAFRRFHHALIDRTDAVDLLRITAGDAVVGYLHNFCHRGRVAAYQSGFNYPAAETHAKPGLTCHQLAIEGYVAAGMEEYDFLAGDDRYKTSLATDTRALYWITLAPSLSLPALAARVRRVLTA